MPQRVVVIDSRGLHEVMANNVPLTAAGGLACTSVQCRGVCLFHCFLKDKFKVLPRSLGICTCLFSSTTKFSFQIFDRLHGIWCKFRTDLFLFQKTCGHLKKHFVLAAKTKRQCFSAFLGSAQLFQYLLRNISANNS